MEDRRAYEAQIVSALRGLPHAALAEVLRLVTLLRDQCGTREQSPASKSNGRASHERTRQLLSTSKGNWAQAIIRDREDRL